jgi:DNA (cytosine-5)-methyltransferase 1
MVVKMKHGSLFSGIGGFDLAAQWMGWENVFHCEKNEFGRKVLNHYWPESISYEDVTQTNFTIHAGAIDILTGGFPCQPYSTAGKRLGKEDDRHLWPEMLRAIREIKPSYVVGENVRGLLNWSGGLVFDEVQADLEAEGYEVLPFLLPACAVNAPHRRDRIWFVAFNSECATDGGYNARKSGGEGMDLGRNKLVQAGREQGADNFESPNSNATDSSIENDGRNIGGKESGQEPESGNGIVSDASTYAQGKQGEPVQFEQYKISIQKQIKSRGSDSGLGEWDATNATSCGRIQNNQEQCTEQPTQRVPDWRSFPTQSPICSGNDGLPTELDGITVSRHRRESIKAYGNAIVPQVAYQIFKAIEETNFQIQ